MPHPIVTHPDPRLRQVSRPVERFDAELASLVDDMFETMHAEEGIGLAAVQIGIHLRLAVMQVEDNPARVLANPTYEKLGEPMPLDEGCLSVPGVRERTKSRVDRVHVRAQDVHGEWYEFEAEGLEAACVQHECDHIDGRLYIDHLTPVRRRRLIKRYERERARETDS
ncbi:Peptide deformylase [wastewater metagenome]|uniref:Peptide deformylase n=2 Tax=unclassified sequences TaxID=12908 RepID=A0A5B8RG57_9ZZZZ|nr:peptide deformylase [Arhodomonas aquaeolei]MCS4506038.1 peptide deformylase [Arhodomonas aquaeolei]QEA06838.1 peptide deformylase [uncultured organism]